MDIVVDLCSVLWKFCLGTYCIKLHLPETTLNLKNLDYSARHYYSHIVFATERQISFARNLAWSWLMRWFLETMSIVESGNVELIVLRRTFFLALLLCPFFENRWFCSDLMLEYVRMRRTPDILRLGNTLAQGTDAIFLEFSTIWLPDFLIELSLSPFWGQTE